MMMDYLFIPFNKKSVIVPPSTLYAVRRIQRYTFSLSFAIARARGGDTFPLMKLETFKWDFNSCDAELQ